VRRTSVALIDEAACIGCTRCIEACPVDAIVGARGMMHTVVAAWCTGCRLCLPPCPVDCIALVEPPAPWTAADARAAARRARGRKARLAGRYARPGADAAQRRAVIEAALRRAGRR
jgi:Na+-translocating ferredoxin:NAD+ oxidoreductase subunit B